MKALLEVPLKGAEGEATLFSEILQLDFLSIVRRNVLYGSIEGGSVERVGVAFKFPGYARQSADLSLTIDQRNFVGDVPLDEAL